MSRPIPVNVSDEPGAISVSPNAVSGSVLQTDPGPGLRQGLNVLSETLLDSLTVSRMVVEFLFAERCGLNIPTSATSCKFCYSLL